MPRKPGESSPQDDEMVRWSGNLDKEEPETTRMGVPGPEEAAARQEKEARAAELAERVRVSKLRSATEIFILQEIRRLQKVIDDQHRAEEAGEEVTRMGESDVLLALQEGVKAMELGQTHKVAEQVTKALRLDTRFAKGISSLKKLRDTIDELARVDAEAAK